MIILYHFPCNDGFCAAYHFHQAYGSSAIYIGINYGDEEIIGHLLHNKCKMYMVDFSVNETWLDRIANSSIEKLIILDHHKSAEERLSNYSHPKVEINFDMKRSGAQLACDYLDHERNWFVDLVGQYDLGYSFKKDTPKEEKDRLYNFKAGLDNQEYDFKKWEQLQDCVNNLIDEGKTIRRFQERLIERCLKHAYKIQLPEGNGWVTNCPVKEIQSEVGNRLAEIEGTYGISYSVGKDIVTCSIRSVEGYNCKCIAESFGGGGHINAAGFAVTSNVWQEIINVSQNL